MPGHYFDGRPLEKGTHGTAGMGSNSAGALRQLGSVESGPPEM